MMCDEIRGGQFLLTWISGYVDVFRKANLTYPGKCLCIYWSWSLSLLRDWLQCLLRDQHQLSVLPANAVTDLFAKHPSPPGWQLVFSQINPPPQSLYPLQPQLRPTRVVCTWSASLKNFGDRESIKPGAEGNIPFSVRWEYFNSDLYSGCAWFESVVHTRSPETFSSSFWAPWLNHKTEFSPYITSRVNLCNPYLNTCNTT